MTSDPFDLASQQQAADDAADRLRLAQQLEAECLKWVMSDKRGRRFVALMLTRAGVWRSSFSTSALTTAFQEGERNVGLRLQAQLRACCPGRYLELLKELENDE